MQIITHIIAFIIGANMALFLYACILVNKDKNYNNEINKKNLEIDLLKKELEEIEMQEIAELYEKEE